MKLWQSVAPALALALVSCGGGGSSPPPSGGGPTPTPSPTPTPTPTPTPSGSLSLFHTIGLFDGDGLQPDGPIYQSADGNLYGVTLSGGRFTCGAFNDSPCGTLYRISLTGDYSILYTFGEFADDGHTPMGSPVDGPGGTLYGVTSSGGLAGGGGTVYRINADGSYESLYSFGVNAGEGYNPDERLLLASDGNFYGTTDEGGADGRGTVYRMTPDGSVTFIYEFTSSSMDGWQPNGALVEFSDGSLYGMTSNGGNSDRGTIFRITKDGLLTTVHHFGPSADQATAPLGGLLLASDGNFYGTAVAGGATNQGAIFRLTPSGTFTTIYEFGKGISDRLSDGDGPNGFLVEGSDGLLYGTTNSGGAKGGSRAGTLFRISKSGEKEILYSFGPLTQEPADPDGGLVLASDGNFYGILQENAGVGGVAGFEGWGAIFRYDPEG